MIKNILRNMKVIELSDADLIEPDIIKDSEDDSVFVMNRSFKKNLYGRLGLSESVSRSLHKIDAGIWGRVIKMKLDESEEISSFNIKCIVSNGNMLISNLSNVVDFDEDKYYSCIESFIEDINSFDNIEEVNSYVTGITRVYLSNEDSDALLLLEIDVSSGWYTLYNGFKNKEFIYLFKNPCVATSNLRDIVMNEGLLKAQYEMTKQFVTPNLNLDTCVSVRELLDFIKFIKADVEIDDEDGLLASISGLSPEASDKIAGAVNAFMTPYKSLKKMKFLRKSIKISSLTFGDLLSIIRNNYTELNLDIGGWLIADLSNSPSLDQSDVLDLNAEGI